MDTCENGGILCSHFVYTPITPYYSPTSGMLMTEKATQKCPYV